MAQDASAVLGDLLDESLARRRKVKNTNPVKAAPRWTLMVLVFSTVLWFALPFEVAWWRVVLGSFAAVTLLSFPIAWGLAMDRYLHGAPGDDGAGRQS